jgi:hypothetical protein
MQYPATSDYNERGFAPPLKPGDYLVKIEDARNSNDKGEKYKDKNGFAYCLFEFNVKGYPDNKLFDRFCFDSANPNININLGKFKQLILACNLSPDESGDTSDLVGKTCKASVTTREYKDEKTGETKLVNKIVQYKQGSITADSPSEPDDDLPF